MKYSEFEQHLRETLGTQHMDINEERLLANLGLDEKKKPLAFWPFLLGIVGISLIGVFGFYLTRDAAPIAGDPDTSNTHFPTVSGDSNAEETTSITSEPLGTTHENTVRARQSFSAKKAKTSVSQDLKTSTQMDYNPTPSSMHTIIDTDISKTHLKAHNIVDITLPSESSSAPTSRISENDSPTGSAEVTQLPSLQALPVVLNTIEGDRDLPTQKQKITCPQFSSDRWSFALGVETGVGLPFWDLSFSGKEQTQGFLYRNEHESPLDAISAKVFGTVQRHNIPVGVKLGLAYNRMSVGLRLQDEVIEMDTTVGIISTTVSPGGDTITHIYGDIITTTTRQIDRTRHYYIHQVEVPVSIFYTLYLNRFAIQPELGINLNVNTWAEGNILTGDNTFNSIKEEAYIKRNTGLAYFGQVNFLYPINSSLDVYAAPSFYYQPSSITQAAYEIDHSYFIPSIKIGCLWRLGR